jgi:hypothetical protein
VVIHSTELRHQTIKVQNTEVLAKASGYKDQLYDETKRHVTSIQTMISRQNLVMKLLHLSDSGRLGNINWDNPSDEQQFSTLSKAD